MVANGSARPAAADAPGGGPQSAPPIENGTLARLRWANLVVGVVHALQAILIAAIATDFRLPVTGAFLEGPPGELPARELLWEFPVGPAVALFLALAAVDHLAVASPRLNGWYGRQLSRGRNPVRWLEYSVSASLMAVLIAALAGITDYGALAAIFALSAGMIVCGWLMEAGSPPNRPPRWAPFLLGSGLGIVPWAIIGGTLIGAEADGTVPGFVYGIFGSLFALYNAFAVNLWLHYRRMGPWRRYAFTEAAFLGLSLTAKTLLAWQVFASTLIPD